MSQDLSFLAWLPQARYATSVAVAGNTGEYGGFLAKFRMKDENTETVLFISGPAKATYTVLKGARLPPLSTEENDTLIKSMPSIEGHDWNISHDPNRIVAVPKTLIDRRGVGFELVMQDAT